MSVRTKEVNKGGSTVTSSKLSTGFGCEREIDAKRLFSEVSSTEELPSDTVRRWEKQDELWFWEVCALVLSQESGVRANPVYSRGVLHLRDRKNDYARCE